MTDAITLDTSTETGRARSAWFRVLVGLGVLGLLAVAGYGAFLLFVTTGSSLAGGGFLLIAIVAGAGAFFSPCSFPFLPSYFAFAEAGRADEPAFPAWVRGSAAALGVVTFNVLLGLVLGILGFGLAQSLSLLGPTPSGFTVGVRVVVGGAIILLGLVQLADLSFHGGLLSRVVRVFQPRRNRHALVNHFVYGFAYTLVGIGCTGPFLATVIVISLAAGGPAPAVAGFLAFSLTMAALMILVSLLAASSRRHLLKGVSARTPAIKRAGGAALIAFGSLLLVLSLWPGLLRPLFP